MNRHYPAEVLMEIFGRFRTAGSAAGVEPFGGGHINDTFRVRHALPGQPDYLLQRKNHQVFRDVPGMVDNIRRVTAHIQAKLAEQGVPDPDRRVLRLVPLLSGDWFLQDEQGNYWTLFLYIPGSRSYTHIERRGLALEGGLAFGRFQNQLADFQGPPLIETIPDFHHMGMRFDRFRAALQADAAGRVPQAEAEIGAAMAWEDRMLQYHDFLTRELPRRITHNDTKIDNVLFDSEDHALCVIDLDTVMPGYTAFDFGDSIRTAANTGREDDPDPGAVRLNYEVFEAYASGFLAETREVLSREELDSLPFSCLYMTFIMGLRFLTDYLMGDVYYKVQHQEHNIARCRAQLRLVESMEDRLGDMEKAVRRLSRP
jgi:aminoglycoside phosphotransferase (APT) family kinase protein